MLEGLFTPTLGKPPIGKGLHSRLGAILGADLRVTFHRAEAGTATLALGVGILVAAILIVLGCESCAAGLACVLVGHGVNLSDRIGLSTEKRKESGGVVKNDFLGVAIDHLAAHLGMLGSDARLLESSRLIGEIETLAVTSLNLALFVHNNELVLHVF